MNDWNLALSCLVNCYHIPQFTIAKIESEMRYKKDDYIFVVISSWTSAKNKFCSSGSNNNWLVSANRLPQPAAQFPDLDNNLSLSTIVISS